MSIQNSSRLQLQQSQLFHNNMAFYIKRTRKQSLLQKSSNSLMLKASLQKSQGNLHVFDTSDNIQNKQSIFYFRNSKVSNRLSTMMAVQATKALPIDQIKYSKKFYRDRFRKRLCNFLMCLALVGNLFIFIVLMFYNFQFFFGNTLFLMVTIMNGVGFVLKFFILDRKNENGGQIKIWWLCCLEIGRKERQKRRRKRVVRNVNLRSQTELEQSKVTNKTQISLKKLQESNFIGLQAIAEMEIHKVSAMTGLTTWGKNKKGPNEEDASLSVAYTSINSTEHNDVSINNQYPRRSVVHRDKSSDIQISIQTSDNNQIPNVEEFRDGNGTPILKHKKSQIKVNYLQMIGRQNLIEEHNR